MNVFISECQVVKNLPCQVQSHTVQIFLTVQLRLRRIRKDLCIQPGRPPVHSPLQGTLTFGRQGLPDGVQTVDKVAGVELIQRVLSHACHDAHARDDVGRVSELDPDLGQWRPERTHAERNHVHLSTWQRKRNHLAQKSVENFVEDRLLVMQAFLFFECEKVFVLAANKL